MSLRRLANIAQYWFRRPAPQLVYRVIGDTLVCEEYRLTWRGLWVGQVICRERIESDGRLMFSLLQSAEERE